MENMVDEQKLIATANCEFESGQFNACRVTLNSLGAARPNDWKVALNKAVVEFYETGKVQFETFQNHVKTISEQLNVNIAESNAPEDIDHSILYFNQAILYFLQGQKKEALDVVNKIFPLIQDMEESLAQKVSLLVLDLNMYFGYTDKALDNISHIEEQLTSSSLTMPKKPDEDKVAPANEFKIILLNHKARCHLALERYEACKADLDAIFAADGMSFTSVMTKAKLYVKTNKFEEALETLHTFQNDIENFHMLPRDKLLTFYNNLSIVNHLLGRAHSSSYFAVKALSEYKEGVNKKIENHLFTPPVLLKLLYNRGVSLLFKGEPVSAFDCFLEASQAMHRSPLVWLRLAECCVMINKSGNAETFNLTQKRKHLVEGLCGSGPLTNIVLNNKIYQDSSFSSEPQSYAVPMPTMEFGAICGRNALCLLPNKSSKLTLGILSVNAYIRLSIGDPVLAIKYATALSAEPAASSLYKYLSRLYIAEAYVYLDQIDKAIQTLDPSGYKDCDPTEEAVKIGWVPNTTTGSQSVFLYNLAVALTIRKDFEKASEILKHVWVSRGQEGQVPVHILALALYIELVQGRVDVAKTIIKQNCSPVLS